MKKILFYIIWLGSIILVPFIVLNTTPLSLVLRNTGSIFTFIQRVSALMTFLLLFYQIILGSYMDYWTDKLGGWIFNIHVFQGIFIYTLVLFHTISFLIFNYLVGRGIDPFFIYINICGLCQTKADYYYTLGRISFWILTGTVFVGLFRMKPFLRNNWLKIHALNYILFLIVAVHGLLLGTDTVNPIVRIPFFVMSGIVLVIAGLKTHDLLKKS